MKKVDPKYIRRERRKKSIRRIISGSADRPRLSVFKSNKGIYAQLIDDDKGMTLCSSSTLDKEYKGKKLNNKETAKEVGKLLGKRALDKGINRAVFDRNGYIFHGKVASLKEGCEEIGLKFSKKETK
ncbi:MAG: 50S ribosomal protein L18 [Spirochaetota bacterium]